MASLDLTLAQPPPDAGQRNLWIQHAAGRLLVENVRGYALRQIDESLSERERSIAKKAVDQTLYGLMMQIDGVSGWLTGHDHSLAIMFTARLVAGDYPFDDDAVIDEVVLNDADGMCMGYHGWIAGDFGDMPVVIESTADESETE